MLELQNITKKYDDKYILNKLSGGEQQRVALTRVLMKKCNMIPADEPTGSLDS